MGKGGRTFPFRLVHEGDASFWIGHPLHIVMSPWWFSVTVDGRTLSSRLFFFFFFFFWVTG